MPYTRTKTAMNVLLIEPNIHTTPLIPPIALPALKGYLHTNTQHHARIIDLVFHKHDWQPYLLTILNEEHPDLIGLSTLSFTYIDALAIAHFLKTLTPAPIILGGVHVILQPDQTINEPDVDMICTGEGEHTLNDLLDHHLNPTDVPGLWYKKDGHTIKNPPRPLIDDLDSLGIPDYTDYDIPRYFFINHHHLPIMATRGCPYSCAYCSNPALRKTLTGRYVRTRTADSLINEIDTRVTQYKDQGLRFLYFFDDTFILNRALVTDFCTTYKQKRYHEWLRWTANVRANLVTSDLMTMMKDAGCYQVRMGVETGNEHLRNAAYHRGMTNSQLQEAFAAIHTAGLSLRLYFIAGAPQETLPMMHESLTLAKQTNAESFFSVLYPLPGTEIQQACKDAKTLIDSPQAALGTIPVTHTLTVTPQQLIQFMKQVGRWQMKKYFHEGLRLKGPRFLLDSLWYALYLRRAYDLERNHMFLWNVQRYELDTLTTTHAAV